MSELLETTITRGFILFRLEIIYEWKFEHAVHTVSLISPLLFVIYVPSGDGQPSLAMKRTLKCSSFPRLAKVSRYIPARESPIRATVTFDLVSRSEERRVGKE